MKPREEWVTVKVDPIVTEDPFVAVKGKLASLLHGSSIVPRFSLEYSSVGLVGPA